ncbi:MAG: DUF5119 domain-containing protein [Bacteroidales bacterium]|nr:DUF5119 domain-containing protein [Bacteroidales bacterium]
MTLRRFIPAALTALVLLGGCTIEPPLHLRKTVATKVVLQTRVSTDILWQINWQTQWDYAWQTELYGPLGYSEPKSMRMHVYTLGDDGLRKAHNTYNFNGTEGTADIFVGYHDMLFHNNNSEVLLFRSDDDLSDINAYTRIISSGLKTSMPVLTLEQKAMATKADDETEIEESVTFMPDELFTLYKPNYYISDNLDDYEYIDGKYVLRIQGELRPATFIWLIQVKFVNNYDRVIGSMGGAAITGMSYGVNMTTGLTEEMAVSVPMDVHMNKSVDPDMMGARVLSFGIPGCNPYDDASVAAAPQGRHWFVLNVNFSTGTYKNIRIDVTDQIRALPTGGVITLEVDVDDFPPEITDPPVSGGGGFNPIMNEWEEEVGSTTIIY